MSGGRLGSGSTDATRRLGWLPPITNSYYFASPPGNTTTSALSPGNARIVPWPITETVAIDRLGSEVATAGDAGSTIRLFIYGSDSTGLPSSLLLDAGEILGDSATVQELTIPETVLTPGLYWFGACSQNVTVTDPILRVTSAHSYTFPIRMASIPVAALGLVGYRTTGVTGALPPTWTSSTTSGTPARLFYRVAP